MIVYWTLQFAIINIYWLYPQPSALKFFFSISERVLLHRSFQAIMDTEVNLAQVLAREFCSRLTQQALEDRTKKTKLIQLGLSLGQSTTTSHKQSYSWVFP